MREFRLFLYFCLGVMLGGYSVFSYAETIAATPGPYEFKSRITGVVGASFSLAVCKQPGSALNTTYYTCPTGTTGAYQCSRCQNTTTLAYWVDVVDYAPSYTCPTGQNWTLQGSSCVRPDPVTCTGDQTPKADGSGCECASGTSYSGYTPATGSSTFVCFNGCEAMVGSASNQFAVGGQQVWKGTWGSTGSVCSAGTPAGTTGPLPGTDSTACTGNQVPGGTINGRTLCVDPGPDNPAKRIDTKSTDTTDPDGSRTTQKQTTTTQCDGDDCDTTTTTQGPGGTTTTTTQQSADSYCAENPNAAACKQQDDKDFCKNNPDALMCQKPELTPGEAGQFEDQTEQVTAAKDRFSSALSEIRAEASGLFSGGVSGGGGVLPNFGSVSFLGRTISLDLSQYDQYFSQVGAAVVLVATFMAALIMFL